MRKLWLGILATLLVALFVAPSYAWELSMTGEYEWRQNYISRMGQNDIFGNTSIQDNGINPTGTFIGFAGPSIYTRAIGTVGATVSNPNDTAAPLAATSANPQIIIARGGYSTFGDAAWIGDQRLTFRPSIQVNKAVRIHGVYTVGGFRNKYAQNNFGGGTVAWPPNGAGIPPFERYYALTSSTSAYNTAAIGSWEQVRATIQLPIGIFSYGIKDFPFGTGLTFSNNSRTDSFLMVVPYGPFRFLFAAMPNEHALFPGWGVVPDTDRKWSYRFGPGFTYDNGPLSLGFLNITQSMHIRKTLNTNGAPLVANTASRDTNQYTWGIFAKYNNGRFFANAEYAWVNADTRYNYSALGAPQRGLSGPRYVEMNKWMAEFGALFGPAKLTLFAAYSSGQVLPGVDINANAASTFNPTKQYAVLNANYQVLQPYSFLMFHTYGGGNNRFNPDGTGEMGDAFALAARIDYAAAANLNLWGSYIHARRAEKHGYYAGSFGGDGATYVIGNSYPTTVAGALSPINAQTFRANYGGTNQNPFVDDDFIGWEAQAGVDWKLLENFSAQFAYSYWQLGPWFDQAYQAFGGNTFVPASFMGNGILAGRDPIQSIRGSLTIDF